MAEHHILNLGAGVQSTTVYLMAVDGEWDFPIDHALFADTGDEPDAVYAHLEWLESLGGPKIHRVTHGKLGDDLISGVNSTGQRFASIPAFTSSVRGERQGMTRRQCTAEYKIQPIEKWIRRELLGLKPGKRIPKDADIHQYFGFSWDEPGRAARLRMRFKQMYWGEVHFPLIDLEMTRMDCQKYLESRVPHHVPRSACVFCPYKSNREWRDLKNNDQKGWDRAVEVDAKMREEESICGKGLNKKLYVHSSCVPLSEAPLGEDQLELFDMECEGGCGL